MTSRTRSLSQLAQTNLGRQIAGRLHRRSHPPLQTGRRIREGYGATRRSSLVWPGQSSTETTSEFPVEDDGLERLRRLRDALAQRQADTGTPAPRTPQKSQMQPGQEATTRSTSPSSRSNRPKPPPRPTHPSSSPESGASFQRSPSDRSPPASDRQPRRRAIVEEITPASAAAPSAPADPTVPRRSGQAQPRKLHQQSPAQRPIGRHNREKVSEPAADRMPALSEQSNTVQREPDHSSVATQETRAEQPTDMSDLVDAPDAQPAQGRTTEGSQRPAEPVRSRPTPAQRERAISEDNKAEQPLTSSQSPAPQVQRRTDAGSPSSVPHHSASSQVYEPPAPRRAELSGEPFAPARHAKPSADPLAAARRTELSTESPMPARSSSVRESVSDEQSAAPTREQGKMQHGTAPPAVTAEPEVGRKPAPTKQAPPSVEDTPGSRPQSTQPHTVWPTSESPADVEHHGEVSTQPATAQGDDSHRVQQQLPVRTDRTDIADLTGEPATSKSPSSQERVSPDASTTATQPAQQRLQTAKHADSTPASDMPSRTPQTATQIDTGRTPPTRDLPMDQPPMRVDAETLLALATEAQERALPVPQSSRPTVEQPEHQSTQRQTEQQPAPSVHRSETSAHARSTVSAEPPSTAALPADSDLAVSEQPTVVQRALAEDATARTAPTPAPETEPTSAEDEPTYDVDAMARDVYQILRRRLRVERERTRGWR